MKLNKTPTGATLSDPLLPLPLGPEVQTIENHRTLHACIQRVQEWLSKANQYRVDSER